MVRLATGEQGTQQKGTIQTNFVWENGFVLEKILCPVHECVDILRGREFSRSFILVAIFP